MCLPASRGVGGTPSKAPSLVIGLMFLLITFFPRWVYLCGDGTVFQVACLYGKRTAMSRLGISVGWQLCSSWLHGKRLGLMEGLKPP